MAAQPHTGVSVEDYLAFERASAEKHNYRDGAIVAMARVAYTHDTMMRGAYGRTGRTRPVAADKPVRLVG